MSLSTSTITPSDQRQPMVKLNSNFQNLRFSNPIYVSTPGCSGRACLVSRDLQISALDYYESLNGIELFPCLETFSDWLLHRIPVWSALRTVFHCFISSVILIPWGICKTRGLKHVWGPCLWFNRLENLHFQLRFCDVCPNPAPSNSKPQNLFSKN